MSERLGKVAGEALAAVAGASVVDAIVMASRGDVVYTSDFDELPRVRGLFRSLRLGVARGRTTPPHPKHPLRVPITRRALGALVLV